MQKPKVIFIGKLPPPYIGPSLATEIILNSSLKEKFELIHLDTSDHRDINTLGAFDFTNFYLAFKHYLELIKLIIKCNPDLIYSPIGQTTISYFRDSIFVIISKFFNKKIVCHLRGGNFKYWYDMSSILTKFYVRKIHPLIDGQIVLGNNLRSLFNWLMPDNKIFVVPNGKNIFSDKRSKSDKNSKINILFFANFHKSKGIIDAISSLKYLNGYQNDYQYIFAGSWRAVNTKIEFEEILKEVDQNKIKVVGSVIGDAKVNLFYESDIFLFPTYYPYEGHPWVIVEAMAAGLPIITTNHAAIPESVYDGVNGFIIDKKNPQQIAEKLKILIEDSDLRKRMGEASRRLYLENSTEEKMVEKFSNVFNTVINNNLTPSPLLTKERGEG